MRSIPPDRRVDVRDLESRLIDLHPSSGTMLTALEALRLDLMRLHAGKASLDELTQDVAEARRIGEEIDAEMKGRDAVRELLADE